MQIIFDTNYSAIDFSNMNSEIFPSAPDRCPFKDCSMPVKLRKHGYYKRFFISKSFSGILYVRRYICPICGRTVSMLPVFCLQYFQYSALDILNILCELYLSGIPLNRLVKKIKQDFPFIERRTINYYRKRIILNRKLIQYGLNLISPEFIFVGAIPENQDWVKTFLGIVLRLHPHVFLCDFSNITGKSFLTSEFMIA
ncbi:hypothetical protein [Schnuerera ultunensis]|uniref:Transposase n=2 Tax=Schnuerera ultunensis TaxID=45497 RepID=A0A1M4PPI2_9FIRM|nr:hypothetical protein [Schnuerera ultunensis]NLP35146.1 hypothetical protein [Clostridiales bacterium]SHD77378.1 protein of unknown function [[Clostridium] ultunense Esp]